MFFNRVYAKCTSRAFWGCLFLREKTRPHRLLQMKSGGIFLDLFDRPGFENSGGTYRAFGGKRDSVAVSALDQNTVAGSAAGYTAFEAKEFIGLAFLLAC